MPKRVKISTKTTRNEEFNYYYTDDTTRAYVTSATANSAAKDKKARFQNIKLLDVNETIIQEGKYIANDSANNTTLIEMSLQVDIPIRDLLHKLCQDIKKRS